MRSTATTLFSNSSQTSSSADGAVSASNEASTNVETAAVAADELSGSINEISRQLAQTTEIVRQGGRRGAQHQRPDQRAVAGRAENRRRHQAHPRHRRPDQPACAQRHDRSGTRRRSRQRLCGRRFGSQITGRADRQGDRRHFQAIVAVQAATSSAVSAIGRISGRMQEIDSCATAVEGAVEEQSAATGEISQNVVERCRWHQSRRLQCSGQSPGPPRKRGSRPKTFSRPHKQWRLPPQSCGRKSKVFSPRSRPRSSRKSRSANRTARPSSPPPEL